MSRYLFLSCVGLLAGCGGSSGGNASGTLQGQVSFPVSSAIAWTGTQDTLQTRTFDLSSSSYTCAQAQVGDAGFQASGSFLASALAGTVSAPSITPGHYPNDAGGTVDFYFQNANGNAIQVDLGDTGTVDVESVQPDFKGSFTAKVGLGDGGLTTLSGTFDAPYCP